MAAKLVKTASELKDYIIGGVTNLPKDKNILEDVAVASSKVVSETLSANERYLKSYKTLTNAEKKEVDELREIGLLSDNHRGKRVPTETALENGYSENAVKAYDDLMDLSDAVYDSDNDIYRIPMEKNNFKMNQDEIILKEYNPDYLLNNYDGMIIRTPKGVVSSVSDSAQDLYDNYLQKGYKLYGVHPLSRTMKELDYNAIISDAEELLPLPKRFLPYTEGGPRLYDSTYRYVKVGNTGNVKGKRVLMGDSILKAGKDLKRLDRYADEYNQAMKAFTEAEGDMVQLQKKLDAIDFKEFGLTSANSLKRFIESKKIDPLMKAQVTKFGEHIIDDTGAIKDAFPDLDYSSEIAEGYMRNNKYFKGRTKWARDIDNQKVPLNTVKETQKKLVERLVQNKTFGQLQEDWGEMFKEKYSHLLDTSQTGFDVNAVSGKTLLKYGVLKNAASVSNEADKLMIKEAANFQNTFRNLMSFPTPLDMTISNFNDGLLRALPRNWQNNKALAKMAAGNPLNFLMGLTYRFVFSFLNMAQLWKQGPHSVLNAFGIAPVQTSRALLISPWVVAGVYFKDVRGLMKYLSTYSGMSPKDFTQMLEWMDKRATRHKFSSFAGRPTIDVKTRLDTLPAELSNNLAAIIIDTAAYLSLKNKSYRAFVLEGDKLMLFPDRYATSRIQQGVFRMFSTWTHYPLRWMEMMLKDKKNGGVLTRKERVGLLASMLASYGIQGIIGKEVGYNVYDVMTDNGVDEETASYLADGIITNIAAEYGYDIREGVAIGDVVERLFNVVNLFSEDFGTMPEIPAVAAKSQTAALVKLMSRYVNPETNSYDLLQFYRNLATIPYLPTGLKNVGSFAIGLHAREFLDKYGDVIPLKDRKPIMSLLGIKPIETRAISEAYKKDQREREELDKLFEKTVLPKIEVVNTYTRPDLYDVNRDMSEKRRAEEAAYNAWKEYYAYVREHYPHRLKDISTKYNRARFAGKKVGENYNDNMKKFYLEALERWNKENR